MPRKLWQGALLECRPLLLPWPSLTSSGTSGTSGEEGLSVPLSERVHEDFPQPCPPPWTVPSLHVASPLGLSPFPTTVGPTRGHGRCPRPSQVGRPVSMRCLLLPVVPEQVLFCVPFINEESQQSKCKPSSVRLQRQCPFCSRSSRWAVRLCRALPTHPHETKEPENRTDARAAVGAGKRMNE